MNNFDRSAGFDFTDGTPTSPNNLEQHPDLAESSVSGTALHRNKTERRRLQGLQKIIPPNCPAEEKTLKERLNVWLINEGGRKVFFGVWIFLHLLVAVFGFVHYQLKDNLDDARALFGVTFGS